MQSSKCSGFKALHAWVQLYVNRTTDEATYYAWVGLRQHSLPHLTGYHLSSEFTVLSNLNLY